MIQCTCMFVYNPHTHIHTEVQYYTMALVYNMYMYIYGQSQTISQSMGNAWCQFHLHTVPEALSHTSPHKTIGWKPPSSKTLSTIYTVTPRKHGATTAQGGCVCVHNTTWSAHKGPLSQTKARCMHINTVQCTHTKVSTCIIIHATM